MLLSRLGKAASKVGNLINYVRYAIAPLQLLRAVHISGGGRNKKRHRVKQQPRETHES